jgi:Tol biopolymer transport system component
MKLRHFTGACLLSLAVASAPARASQRGGLSYDVAYVADGQIFVVGAEAFDSPRAIRQAHGFLTTTSWSPDGHSVILLGCPGDPASPYRLPLHFHLCVVSSDGRTQERLIDPPIAPFVEWSPDSRRIVFASSYEDPERDSPPVQRGVQAPKSAIYVLDVGSRRTTRVTPLGDNMFPAWSPDGRRIAFSGDVDDAANRDIYIVDSDGRNMRRLTTTATIDVQPEWSRKSDLIAFVAAPRPQTPTDGGVSVMRPDGSDVRRIWIIARDVTWSPDGRSVLVVGASPAIVDVATRAAIALEHDIVGATFAPDGRSILFRTTTAGDRSLYLYDLANRTPRKLAATSSFAASPLRR